MLLMNLYIDRCLSLTLLIKEFKNLISLENFDKNGYLFLKLFLNKLIYSYISIVFSHEKVLKLDMIAKRVGQSYIFDIFTKD